MGTLLLPSFLLLSVALPLAAQQSAGPTNQAATLEQVRNVLGQAAEAAAAIREGPRRDLAFKDLAIIQARVGNAGLALTLTAEIESQRLRYEALANLAREQAKLGDISGAHRTLDLIPEDFDQLGSVLAFALHGVAAAQAENGDVIGALQTAHSIPAEAWAYKSGALEAVAYHQARHGDLPGASVTWEQAKEAAEAAGSVDSIVPLLIGVASAQAQVKDRLGAEHTIQRAISIARAEKQKKLRDSMLSHIARSLAAMGDFGKALVISEEVGDETLHDSLLFHTALSQKQSGELEKALETSFSIKGEESRDFVLLGIAAERAGDKEFERALQMVHLIRTTHTRAEALALVAFYQAYHGHRLAAAEVFAQANGVAQEVQPDLARDTTLNNVARRQAGAGFIKEALETASKIKNENSQEVAFEEIASTQARQGYWEQALERTLALDVSRLRARALMGVAEGMFQWICTTESHSSAPTN